MIPPELRVKIRRLYFAEHWRVGTIAKELSVHHDAVRRALELDGTLARSVLARPMALGPYKDLIVRVLEEHPRLCASRLFEMVRARGYPGGVAQVRRYVRQVRPVARAEAYLSLTTLPGEQAQVDWGSFGKLEVGHAKRPLSCFVMVLSWSRGLFARFTLDQKLESFVAGHVLAFEAFGGVPRAILYDNLKSVVLERVGDAIRFHPRLLELAGHYHFEPRPCAPYRGNEKGKVERTIRYLRDSFFAARRFSSLADLNAQLESWIRDVAHERKAPRDQEGRKVQETLESERPKLLALPEHRFPSELVQPVSSGKTPYVRFDGNDYSIPHTHVKKPLTLCASEVTVRLLDGAQELARHPRSYDKGAVVEDPEHLQRLAQVKRQAHEIRGRDLLCTLCKNARPLVEELARRGEHVAPHTLRLLKLLDRYGPSEVDRAISETMARGALSADAVAQLLDQETRRHKLAPVLQPIPLDDPRIRNLRVAQHALEPYDALGTLDGQKKDGEK
ncbi:MAG: IS21 family transposase [Deltaproteobacteria bacterium]